MARGASIAAVCTGAFILAEMGLLDGRRPTTNRQFTRWFKKRYPNVILESEHMLVQDGNIITTGKVYFQRGGMQAQVNMIDPKMLMDARNNPDLYPNLLIRVSGYSAYFNDLSPQMKNEIISRSFNEISS